VDSTLGRAKAGDRTDERSEHLYARVLGLPRKEHARLPAGVSFVGWTLEPPLRVRRPVAGFTGIGPYAQFCGAWRRPTACGHRLCVPRHRHQRERERSVALRYEIHQRRLQQISRSEGYPAIKPPWGTLNAINLDTGKIDWTLPLGEYPELAAKGLKQTGSENYGGPVLTAGGLLFIGATNYDKKFRAFDKDTGKLLWETTLPVAGNATPATYQVNGRQFVVIAPGEASGGRPPGLAMWRSRCHSEFGRNHARTSSATNAAYAHEAYSVSENRLSQPSSLSQGRRGPTDMPLVRAMETQIDSGTQVSAGAIVAELDCPIRLSAQRASRIWRDLEMPQANLVICLNPHR